MNRHHDRPPDMKRPGQRGSAGTGLESSEAGNLTIDYNSVIHLPRDRWHVPMMLARQIAWTPRPLKAHLVRPWRIAVQVALGEEVQP